MFRRVTTVAVSVAVLGLSACAGETPTKVSPSSSESNSSSSSSTTQAPASGSSSSSSAAEPSSSAPTQSAKVTPDQAMAALMAYESQAEQMVKHAEDKQVSEEFRALVSSIGESSDKRKRAIVSWSNKAGTVVTASTPEGLLMKDQLDGVAIPDGDEFERTWKLLMKDQRQAALKYVKAAAESNPEVKALVGGAEKDFAEQLEKLSK